MPFSSAIPKRAMKPTDDGTERFCPVAHRATIPPTSASGMLAMIRSELPIAAALAAAVTYLLNRPFYAFLSARRGLGFALRVVPLHYLFHLNNGASFVIGSVIYGLGRCLGLKVPGAIPLEAWSRTALLIGDPKGSRAEAKSASCRGSPSDSRLRTAEDEILDRVPLRASRQPLVRDDGL